jgi:hypothetical protein
VAYVLFTFNINRFQYFDVLLTPRTSKNVVGGPAVVRVPHFEKLYFGKFL